VQPAPVDVSAPLANARHLLAIADYPGAETALRAILVTAPDSADAHFMLGFALLHEQKPAESLNEYTQGAKGSVPGAEQLIGVASDYVLLKDFQDAERWLLVAAKDAPERPLIWYMLGRAQYNLNHWGDAERSFLTCLRLDPHHTRAEYNLGLVYEAQQHPDAAIAAYKLAISWQDAAPTRDVQPYLDLGMLLRRQGKIADSLPMLTVAAGNGSRNPLAHQELGLAYEQLGRYDEAIGELKAAIQLTPKIEALHFFLGRLYRKAGRRDEAAAEFALAAKLSGTQSDASVPNLDVTE
jgi:tetratricopeptide (TPR) repeat protein